MNDEINLQIAQLNVRMDQIREVLEIGDVDHDQFIQATRIAAKIAILKAYITSKGDSNAG